MGGIEARRQGAGEKSGDSPGDDGAGRPAVTQGGEKGGQRRGTDQRDESEAEQIVRAKRPSQPLRWRKDQQLGCNCDGEKTGGKQQERKPVADRGTGSGERPDQWERAQCQSQGDHEFEREADRVQRLGNVMARSERGQEDRGRKEQRGQDGKLPSPVQGHARPPGISSNGSNEIARLHVSSGQIGRKWH